MDFENLNADENLILTRHFTAGRSGYNINKIVLHHNAGDLTIRDCYNVWQSREASAHYQVESSGRIGQLVWDNNTAWHAGDWVVNCSSIGIEHANRGDSITDEVIENGAHLVASLCKFYGLGRPTWGVNVFGHSNFAPTACPGALRVGTSYHDRYMTRAGEWYDIMTGVKPMKRHIIEKKDNAVYRLFNANTNRHMFTNSYEEAQSLSDNGWNDEKIAWFSPNDGDSVYRMFNPSQNDHLFTTSALEALRSTLLGYVFEGTTFKSGTGTPVYRLFNITTGEHFFTTDIGEREALISDGWNLENCQIKTK